MIQGKVVYEDKEEINFNARVNQFGVSAKLVDEDDPEILSLNTKAQKMVFDYHFRLGQIKYDT